MFIICPKCKSENFENAKFCCQCAEKLGPVEKSPSGSINSPKKLKITVANNSLSHGIKTKADLEKEKEAKETIDQMPSPLETLECDDEPETVNIFSPELVQVTTYDEDIDEDEDDTSIVATGTSHEEPVATAHIDEDEDEDDYVEQTNNSSESISARKSSIVSAQETQSRPKSVNRTLDDITNDAYYNDILPDIDNEMAFLPKDIIGKVVTAFALVIVMAVFLIVRR